MGIGIRDVKRLAGTGRRRVALFGTTGAAAAVAVGLLASPAGASPAPAGHPAGVRGIEHVQLMTTSATTNTLSAVVWGVFTAGGVDQEGTGNTDVFVFPGGTFKVTHSDPVGPQSFNPKTCLTVLSQHGTYVMFGGTGKYKGLSGHGTYKLSVITVGAKTASGACSQTAAPLAFQEVIDASGPVRLP